MYLAKFDIEGWRDPVKGGFLHLVAICLAIMR